MPPAAFLARAWDLAASQWSLWASSALVAGEGVLRDAAAPQAALRSARRLAIGALAADLYSGYALLRERERWSPWLVREQDWALQHRRGAGRLLDAAEALGGSLIKAGQFASTRPDLVPAAYAEGLSSLQDGVPPEPWPEVEAAVERETGRPLAETFASFEREPLAAASIAQVHRARLRDGRAVAVKVRRPGIGSLVEADLDALEWVFDGVGRLEPGLRLRPITDYLRWTLPLELDLGREAREMAKLREALADREDVIVPEPLMGLCSPGLLVMELVEGVKITDTAAMLDAGIEPREVAMLLNDAYADQLLARRVLHADPHPGNLLVQPGPVGPRLVLLDHGLTLEIEPDFADTLSELVGALGGGDLDGVVGALRGAGMSMGEGADLETILRVVGVLLGKTDSDPDDFGGVAMKLGASVGDVPPRLLLVGRAIGLLDGITRRLDPEADALEIVAGYAKSGT